MPASQKRTFRLILLCLSGCGLLYVSGAYALFLLVKYQQGHAGVAFGDVLLPDRWPEFKAAKGRSLIEKSLAQFRNGHAAAGFINLRLGLARYPASREGRLLLAQIHADNQRSDLARELLVGGLAYHQRDPDYLRIVFTYLLTIQADADAIRLADQVRRHPAMDATLRDLAGMAAATVCLQRGHYDRAENYLTSSDRETSRDHRLLRARIQWERGRTEPALQIARDLAAEFPDDEEVYALHSSFLRESGSLDEARRESLLYHLRRPDSVLPRLDLLHAYAREGQAAKLRQAADAMLHDFVREEKGLLALGDFAATTGDVTLARQVCTRLPAGTLAGQGAAVLTLEAAIKAKDYMAALAMADELTTRSPSLPEPLLTLCQGLKAVAHYGSNDPTAGLLAINRLLAGPGLRANNLLMISNLLDATGARNPARDLLVRSIGIDPQNQAVLSRLIELDLAQDHLESLPARVQQLVTMRRPSRELLSRAAARLGSDRMLFMPERAQALAAIRTHLQANPKI